MMFATERKVSSRSAAMVALAGLAFGASHAHAQVWNNSAGGDWSNPLNWTPNVVPNANGANASIDAPGAYVVSFNGSFTMNSLSIPVAGRTVSIVDGGNFRLATGGISNNGQIVVNTTGGVNATILRLFAGNSSVSGTGAIVMNAGPNTDTGVLLSDSGSWSFTNGAGHTIRGTGRISSAMVNNGLVNADVAGRFLRVNANVTNNNLYTATSGGTLEMNSASVTQTPTAQIQAAGGTVRLNSTSVSGGTISGSGASIVEANNLTAVGVTTLGSIHVTDGFNLRTTTSLTNNGTVTVNPTAGNNATALRLSSGSATLQGSGTVALNASPNVDTAIIVADSSAWSLTHAAPHLIRGTGRLQANIINNSTINADVPARSIVVSSPITNNSLLTATNNGTLAVNSVAITQPATGVIRADGGTVVFNSGAVSGGQLRNQGGGVVNVQGLSTFDNVTISGGIDVVDGSTFRLGAFGISNGGVITINPIAGVNATVLRLVAGSASLSGGGTVLLNAGGNLDTAYITSDSGLWVLTNTAAHTIRGSGRVYSQVVNQGTFTADASGRRLELLSSPKTNNSLMQATNGGILGINAVVSQGAAGRIVAQNASIVQVYGATVNAGRIESAGTGRVEYTATSTLDNVTLTGAQALFDGQILRVGTGGLTNNAALTINQQSGVNASQVRLVAGNATLAGAGTLVLNASGNLDTAYIIADSGLWVLTNGPTHTIRGTGRVYGALINQGTIRADVATRRLELASSGKTNQSAIRASGGGVLGVNCPVNQTSGASIVADAGTVEFFGATLTGGALDAVNAGITRLTATSTFDGVTFGSGVNLGISDAQTLRLLTGGLVNNGIITVGIGTGVNATTIRAVGGSTSITGSGEVRLNASGNLDTAYFAADSSLWTTTLGPAQSLTGRGRAYARIAAQGRLAPGGSNAANTIEFISNLTLSPSSLVEIDIGGVAPGTFDQIGGAGAKAIAGTLLVNEIGGFSGGIGQEWNIVTAAGGVTGRFDALLLPPAPAPALKWAIQYTANSVILRVTCNADINSDGQIDFFDYLDFVQAINDELPEADYNADGSIDFFDYLDFVLEYDRGCS
ncbi:MAG: hypothetical protein SFZ23_12095 [Planctomycetota bacterium]|nr:hypothetical protein [Planctomycetota bacterium]